MKKTILLLLALWLSFFSHAEEVIKNKQVLISPNNVASWNHIGEKHGAYAGLSQAAHRYQLKTQTSPASQQPLFQVTLVKKLFNWEQQHSNGIEVSLDNLNLSVDQLNQLHFKIKVSPSDSIANASFDALSEQNPWLQGNKKFTKLLSEQANFTLIFYGENHHDAKQNTLYGAYPLKVKLDSSQHWLDINITAADLNYYWQQNYKEKPASIAAIATQKLKGFILVAESGNTKVVRNYIPDSFPNKFTEVFNEFSIVITGFEVTSKP